MSLLDALSGADPARRKVDKWWDLCSQKNPRCDEAFREVLEDENCHKYVVEHLGIGSDGKCNLLDALINFSYGSGVRLYPFLLKQLILMEPADDGYESLLERVSRLDTFSHWCLTQYLALFRSEPPLWWSSGFIHTNRPKEEHPFRELLVKLLAKQGERSALLLLYEAPSPKISEEIYRDYQSLFRDVIKRAVTTKRLFNVNPPSLMATARIEFSTLAGGSGRYLDLFETLPENRRNLLDDLLTVDP